MEFLLLPLLLLAGLFTLFDGSDGNGGDDSGTKDDDDNGTAGDDTLEAAGLDRIYGFGGNDEIALTEEAVGNGGDGADTLIASDDAHGYGNAGNDSLTLADDATGLGGLGDDVLVAGDQSVGYGLEGNDVLRGSDNATVNGGDGNDVLTGADRASLNGGDGDDVLFMDLQRADPLGPDVVHGLPSHMAGGAGADDFVMTGFPLEINGGAPEDDAFMYSGPVVIEDFNPAEDSLGMVVSASDLQGATLEAYYSQAAGGMVVSLTKVMTIDGDATNQRLARVTLTGVTEFDPQDVIFYSDNDLTPLDMNLTGTAGNDVLMSPSPLASAEMQGLAGDDTLTLQRGTIDGGVGNDILSGNGTLMGGQGDDRLTVGYQLDMSVNHSNFSGQGQAYGGAGDDTISATVFIGEDDSFAHTGDLIVDGGAGNDVITSSRDYAIDAGSDDDVVFMTNGGISTSGGPMTLGDGADVVAALSNEYMTLASVADFDPAEDALAVIVPEGAAEGEISVTWDAATGASTISLEDHFEFTLQGVNAESTPIPISFYADQAALMAGTPYRTA